MLANPIGILFAKVAVVVAADIRDVSTRIILPRLGSTARTSCECRVMTMRTPLPVLEISPLWGSVAYPGSANTTGKQFLRFIWRSPEVHLRFA